jgi:hypothetical protein
MKMQQTPYSRRNFLGTLLAGAGIVVLSPLEVLADTKIKLPGIESPVSLADKILQDGHFSWSEAIAKGTRIPETKEITDNIIKVAKTMEEVRAYLGNNPITVNSWYRTPEANETAGGVKNSPHLQGYAVDFVVQGIDPLKVYEKLDPWHGDKGGLGKYSGFTHIDIRGYKARWSGN